MMFTDPTGLSEEDYQTAVQNARNQYDLQLAMDNREALTRYGKYSWEITNSEYVVASEERRRQDQESRQLQNRKDHFNKMQQVDESIENKKLGTMLEIGFSMCPILPQLAETKFEEDMGIDPSGLTLAFRLLKTFGDYELIGQVLKTFTAMPAVEKVAGGALADASSAAFQAADDIAGWYPKVKHLLSGAGSKARFATDSADEVRALVQEGLRSPNAVFAPNPNLEGTFRVITDMGRAIGIKGQQFLRTIVGADGKVINSFPVNGL